MAVNLSTGFSGDMAGLAWPDDEGREKEEEVEDEEGVVAEEEGEWWLCWIRSGRWCMWPAKPFFSGSPRLGGWGWPWTGPGPAGEEEDERLTNRFVSTVLWKQETGTLGLEQAGREMEEMHVWLLITVQSLNKILSF